MRLDEAGVVWTYPNRCAPLDDVRIVFERNGLKGNSVTFHFTDADHQPYLQQTVTAGNGKAELTMKPAGKPGVHHIKVWTDMPDGSRRLRNGSFRVCASTAIHTDTGEMDDLLDLLGEALLQTIDVTNVNGKPRTYYKAADNSRENLAYPAYGIGGLRYYLDDLKSMFEAVYDNQWPDGRLPDHVYGDATGCPLTPRKLRTCMADLETGVAVTLCEGWHAHGDMEWLREMLPRIEAGIEFVRTDPVMFDQEHSMIKRPHSLDEWDIGFTEAGEHTYAEDAGAKFVLMQGDTSRLCQACDMLSEAFAALGDRDRSTHYRKLRDHYYSAGNELFWDGTKYIHHVHLDEFDHGDFDESDQLTMSCAGALTRGFADHEEAVSIINEYVRRWEETGDAYPWWSLQPGYPDKLNYFRRGDVAWSKSQGEYCNGGLFPWVGGELCRAAFRHGMEALAYRLLQDVHAVMKRDNGALFTWYNLDGSAAINAPHHQTNYDPWGIGPWTQAVVEEMAGIKTQGPVLKHATCTPRWPAAGVKTAHATAHFPASDTYFSYQYQASRDRIALHFAGTGETVTFSILLPGWATCGGVTLDGKKARHRVEKVEESAYVTLDADIVGVRELVVSR